MSNISLDSHTLEQLHKEQKALLDTIDSLRKHRVDRFVDLPQIICVGDQSSGKSSVLEAISRVRFPIKDGLCTRFATELVLRTYPKTKVDVQIQSALSTSKDVHSFNKTSFAQDDLPKIIEEAKRAMLRNGAAFSEDVLRVEICGPDVPRLTLVDLPGFYHSESESQSAAGCEIVDALAEKYMAKKNSIILAVISARNQITLQKVLSKVKLHDKNQERTLGIITKPDLLSSQSQDEQDFFLQLANNLDTSHTLSLGWHVLRNRGNDEEGSDEERDSEEMKFFAANLAWSSIPSKNRGIEVLRSKLSSILLGHIKRHIHGLISGIEGEMAQREARLKRLGKPRSCPRDLRAYMGRISTQFQILSLNAIEGNYSHEFFGGLCPEGNDMSIIDRRTPKLRALVRDLNRAFTRVLATRGSTYDISPRGIDDDDEKSHGEHDDDEADEDESSGSAFDYAEFCVRDLPQYLRTLVDYYPFAFPKKISFKAAAAILETESAYNQGIEFPGSSNDRVAIEFFRHQSQPWEAIANAHIQLMLSVAKSFVERLLDHIAGPNGKPYSAILTDIVDPFFHQKEVTLQAKLKELLHHYRKGNPQPLDFEFTEMFGDRTREVVADEVLLDLLRSQPELFTATGREKLTRKTNPQSCNRFDVAGLIHKAKAYYEIALRTFIDNIIVLAVENCLIEDIPNLLTTERVSRMEDEELENLAAESEEVQVERAELREEFESLKKGLHVCNQYRERNPTSVVCSKPVNVDLRAVTISETPSTPPRLSSPDAQPLPSLSECLATPPKSRTLNQKAALLDGRGGDGVSILTPPTAITTSPPKVVGCVTLTLPTSPFKHFDNDLSNRSTRPCQARDPQDHSDAALATGKPFQPRPKHFDRPIAALPKRKTFKPWPKDTDHSDAASATGKSFQPWPKHYDNSVAALPERKPFKPWPKDTDHSDAASVTGKSFQPWPKHCDNSVAALPERKPFQPWPERTVFSC